MIRAFAGLEKTSGFYLRNGFFYTKMTLFALVLVLELRPMVTFLRWRIARRKGSVPVASSSTSASASASLPALIRLNDLEVAIVVLIPFVASLMARGVWLF